MSPWWSEGALGQFYLHVVHKNIKVFLTVSEGRHCRRGQLANLFETLFVTPAEPPFVLSKHATVFSPRLKIWRLQAGIVQDSYCNGAKLPILAVLKRSCVAVSALFRSHDCFSPSPTSCINIQLNVVHEIDTLREIPSQSHSFALKHWTVQSLF